MINRGRVPEDTKFLHSDFGGIAAKSSDVFLNPPKCLPFCNILMRGVRNVHTSKTLTILEAEITDTSILYLLTGQKSKPSLTSVKVFNIKYMKLYLLIFEEIGPQLSPELRGAYL